MRPLSRLFSGTTQAGYLSATLNIMVEQQKCAPVRFVYTSNIEYTRVATGQGKVREIQGQGKVREFCAGSGKFEILRKVREIQEHPLKVREI